MLKCSLILTIMISFINCSKQSVNNEDNIKHDCNGLANIFSFSSQISFCKLKGVNKTCILMEENVIDGKRGKLILKKSISNDETQIYYQNDSPSTVIIEKDYAFRTSRVNEFSKDKSFEFVYHENKKKIIGPTAAIITAMNSKKNQLTYEKPMKYRGIDAYSCSTVLDLTVGRILVKKTKIHVIFQELKSPSDSKNKILSLEVKSSLVHGRYDYFKFSINEADKIWRMPSIGAALKSFKKLPDFTGTGIHEIALEFVNESELEIEVEQIDIYFNRKEDLLRIDSVDAESKRIDKLIYNAKASSLYNINDGICKMSLVKAASLPKGIERNLKYLRKLLDVIENTNKNEYRYLGQELIQHIICDVFEFSRVNEDEDRIVHVIYVRHKTDLEQEDANSFPMRVSKIVYGKIENDKYEINSKSIYNLLVYQQLNYGQYYRDIFQTKYCHSDNTDNLYLTILGHSTDFKEEFLTDQHIYQLKEDINQQIRDFTGLAYLQIPELFIEFRPFEIKIELIFEELIRTSDYFETFTKFWIPLDEINNVVYEKNTRHCEKMALKDRSIYGYTYCEQTLKCFLIKNENLFLDGDRKKKANEHCFIKKKILNNQLDVALIHDAYQMLKKQVDEGKFQLNTTIAYGFEKKRILFNLTSAYETVRLDNLENLNSRLPYAKMLTKQRMPKSKIKLDRNVRTIKDCYLNCRQGNCSYFTVCLDEKRNLEYSCELSDEMGDSSELIIDNQCNVYETKNLNLFDKYEKKRFLDRPLDELSTNLNDCSIRCLNRKDKRCKSIVYCDGFCELSDQHMEYKFNRIDHHQPNCSIYSLNYLEDYHQILVKPVKSKESTVSTVKGCALDCAESNTTVSFNFCPHSMDSMHFGDCLCTAKDDPISEETQWNCITMQKNPSSFFHYSSFKSSAPITPTKADGLYFVEVAEVIFILLSIGILIGAFIFSIYRKMYLISSKGIFYSIRFKRQLDEVEIDVS